MRQRGMTLIEVTAVLLLIALLAAFALPSVFRGAGGVEARICRDQLLRDLRTARSAAIGHMHETSVDGYASGYVLHLGTGESIERPLPPGFSMRFQGRGEETRIVFTPDGRSTGGILELWTGERSFAIHVGEEGQIAGN